MAGRSADPWPYPADTPLDRARRIAGMYREALIQAAPDQAARVDGRALELGQPWAVPGVAQWDPDDLLTLDQAADYCLVKTGTLRVWRSRGLRVVETEDGRRYRVRDLWDYQAARRRARLSSLS